LAAIKIFILSRVYFINYKIYSVILKRGAMKKNKLYTIILVLIAVVLFGTAALCNINIPAGTTITTVTSTATGTETTATASSSTEAAGDAGTTVPQSTEAATTTESTAPVGTMVDLSALAPFFAFANDEGSKLISFYSEEGAAGFESLNGAIGDRGHFYPVQYSNKQNSNAQDTSRAVSGNFNNMEGYIYNSAQNTLAANKTYLLCNSNIINQASLLASQGNTISPLDDVTKTQIAGLKGRAVQDAWTIDSYTEGSSILVVLFEPAGNNFLMSIALKTSSGIKFMDFPVVSDGQSAWRVDDGGKIEPKLFSVLFATKTQEGVLFVVCWAGAEGESIFFLQEKNDTLERLPWEIYRYWSAM
jgi:hypothetical protein